MITVAQSKHLKAVNDIYNQAVSDGLRTAHLHPTTLEERKVWFKEHPDSLYPIFIYKKYAEVCGWLSISPYRAGRQALNEVVEVSFYVDYAHHREGIASRLMKHAIRFCKNNNYRLIVAFLINQNEASISLLQKFDFQSAGRIPKAVHHKNEFRDHLCMYKKIEQDSPS